MSAYFKTPEPLLQHLRYLYDNELSPVQLNKVLYFLYGTYAGTFCEPHNTLGYILGNDDTTPLPTELFHGQFYAEGYGPMVKETAVTKDAESFNFDKDGIIGQFMNEFIIETTKTILEVPSIELVLRSQQDSAWIEASITESRLMDNEQIKKDYS